MKLFCKALLTACVCALFILSGCATGSSTKVGFTDTLYSPHFATGFGIYGFGGESSVVSVRNPWQGADAVEMNMFLRRGGEEAPEGFDGVVVDAPLKSVVCMSSTFVAFIDALGEIDVVKGVSGARYISNDTIRARYGRGQVRDVGYDTSINFEAIADMRPDLVLVYGIYGDNAALTRKLDELGIKYMYLGDYVEQTPLGKAEWLIAMGEMFDKRAGAEQQFEGISIRYAQTRDSLASYVSLLSSNKPSVMLNSPYRDTWFVPGDRNYMVRLIADAQGEYVCAGVDSEQSRPISGESAYIFASRADVWLNPGQASNMKELVNWNPRFGAIPSVQNGRVFNCIARSTPAGGSDFWESGAVHADIVLDDMASVLYPDFRPEREFYYFKKLL